MFHRQTEITEKADDKILIFLDKGRSKSGNILVSTCLPHQGLENILYVK